VSKQRAENFPLDAECDASALLLMLDNVNEVSINGSTAAGYPYNLLSLRTKRQALPLASSVAQDILENENMAEYPEYKLTGGRGKLKLRTESDSARLVTFGSLHEGLIVSKLQQPVIDCHSRNLWLTNIMIGISWFSHHGQKLKEWLDRRVSLYGVAWKVYGDDLTLAFIVKGVIYYMSLDLSSFDSRLAAFMLQAYEEYQQRLRERMLLSSPSVLAKYSMKDIKLRIEKLKRVGQHYSDAMINAKIIFPSGDVFQKDRGMSSGYAGTSYGDSQIHDCLVATFAPALVGLSEFDPTHIEAVVAAGYRRFNGYVKPGSFVITSKFGDLPILSKMHRVTIATLNGGIMRVPVRRAVEPLMRGCYPDCFNTSRRHSPVSHSAARACGLLQDGFFVRLSHDILTKMVHAYKTRYNVGRITFKPGSNFRRIGTPLEHMLSVSIDLFNDAEIMEWYGIYGVKYDDVAIDLEEHEIDTDVAKRLYDCLRII